MFGSLCFYKCADGIQSGDRGGTNGGKYNTVSFRHQAWRFIIAAPSIKGELSVSSGAHVEIDIRNRIAESGKPIKDMSRAY